MTMKKIRVAFIGMAHVHLAQLTYQLYEHKRPSSQRLLHKVVEVFMNS